VAIERAKIYEEAKTWWNLQVEEIKKQAYKSARSTLEITVSSEVDRI
jgi:hypothetical protein